MKRGWSTDPWSHSVHEGHHFLRALEVRREHLGLDYRVGLGVLDGAVVDVHGPGTILRPQLREEVLVPELTRETGDRPLLLLHVGRDVEEDVRRHRGPDLAGEHAARLRRAL